MKVHVQIFGDQYIKQISHRILRPDVGNDFLISLYPRQSIHDYFKVIHQGIDPEHFANLFWQLDGQSADNRRICLCLNSHLREIGIRGASAYSFKHAASTELARQ
ncbi:MAG: hypothetical protein EZS28_042172, partial [Streblomastix strix]